MYLYKYIYASFAHPGGVCAQSRANQAGKKGDLPPSDETWACTRRMPCS